MAIWLNRGTWEKDRGLVFEGRVDQAGLALFLADEGISPPPGRKWGPIRSQWVTTVDHGFHWELRGMEIWRESRPSEKDAIMVSFVRQVPDSAYSPVSFRDHSNIDRLAAAFSA